MIEEPKLVAIAGLLHDIGKFRQRAYWGARQNHQSHGRQWVEQEVLPRLRFLTDPQRRQVAEVVERHHEGGVYERDVRVVQLADRLASGERVRRAEEEETGDPSAELLVPVLAELRLDGRGLGETDWRSWAYATVPLELGPGVFPQRRESLRTDYPELWARFQRAWDDLPDESPTFKDPDAFVLTWLSLLRIYAWSVPAAAYRDEPDISLADHLHVTGALSACLWELADGLLDRLEDDPFRDEPVALLVGGDLSGIQRFLYAISSAGAAKSLRGRSAYLSLLCDAVAEYVRRELRLLPCHVLYSGGGHFYLLAPLGAEGRLRELHAYLTGLLLDFFGGEVAVVLEAVPLRGADLRVTPSEPTSPLGKRWKAMSERLRRAKRTLLREAALQDHRRVFGPFGVGGPETFCVVCHSEPDQPEGLRDRGWCRPVRAAAEEVERKCSLCESFEELSARVARARYLLLRRARAEARGELKWHSVLSALGIELWLDDEAEAARSYREGDWVVRLNDPRLSTLAAEGRTVPVVGFRFLPNFTPLDPDGTIRELDQLAGASEGAPYFGSLRMDVDSLGRLFSEGLGGRLSLSRLATLSRSFSVFFEGYLNRICEELDPAHQRLYLLYSGGDDLLAVGSWDAVADLARVTQERFAAYACGNPAVTLSGGTALHHEKFPLYQAAEQAGSLLEAAKAWERDGRKKDACNLWGQPLEWEGLGWVHRWQDRIAGWVRTQEASRAFVFKLGRIADLYRQKALELRGRTDWPLGEIARRVRHDRWTWTLVYSLARERPELQPELDRLRRELLEDGRIDLLLPLSRWVELKTR